MGFTVADNARARPILARKNAGPAEPKRPEAKPGTSRKPPMAGFAAAIDAFGPCPCDDNPDG